MSVSRLFGGWQGGRSSLQKIRVTLAILIALCCTFSVVVHERWLPSPWPQQGGSDHSSSSSILWPPTPIHATGTIYRPRSHRSDQVFPPILSSITLRLPSIPSQHRLPAVAATNVTDYLLASPQHVAPFREYYFDYNPSILRLPPGYQTPSVVSTASTAVYLASARVSNLNYCFHPADRQRMINGNGNSNVKPKDWLGLALLDEDWQVLADVVVDLAAVVRGAQDFRLFLWNHHYRQDDNSDKNDQKDASSQIYISSNDFLLPIWLSKPSADVPTTPLPVVFPPRQQGSSSSTTAGFDVFVPTNVTAFTQCAPCAKPRSCGKNFHFFVAHNDDDDNLATTSIGKGRANHRRPPQLWAEVWPSAPHIVRSVDAPPCRRKNEPRQAYAAPDAPVASFYNAELDVMRKAAAAVAAANGRIQEPELKRRGQAPQWLTRGRGSACCLSIRHPGTGESLLMGIAHSKTLAKKGAGLLQPNHYFSTLYAFEDKPPFAIVAQSGYFCLPFPDDDSDVDARAMVNVTRWRVLRLGDELVYPDCPRIHFVSGMTLDARDASKVVIAYGINDCVSRLIQVDLSAMVKLLFYGPR